MLEKISNLGAVLNRTDQQLINGGYTDCGIFTCTPATDGCLCWDGPMGQGTCMNGMCGD